VKGAVLAAAAGALFALGLVIGGMTIPAKVTGFLDVGGAWDPQLAFVMVAAIAVYAPALRWIRGRRPLAAARFQWPTARAIDARLVGGAALFGIGWGSRVTARGRRWSRWPAAASPCWCSSPRWSSASRWRAGSRRPDAATRPWWRRGGGPPRATAPC